MRKCVFTPELARAAIAAMGPNRKPAPNVVSGYAATMREGGWKADPLLAIRFDDSGKLIDGQHRMLAVIEANIPVEFYTDVTDSQTLELVHQCRSRTLSHRVAIAGLASSGNSGLFASLGGLLYERSRGSLVVSSTRSNVCQNAPKSVAQIAAGWKWSGANSDETAAASMHMYQRQSKLGRLLNPTQIGFLLVQRPDADEFIDSICSDEHPDRCLSAVTFRRQVLNNRYTGTEKLCILSHAFNNRTAKVLRCTPIIPNLIGSTFAS